MTALNLLRRKRLPVMKHRLEVLNILISAEAGISFIDMLTKAASMDRITLYRILRKFVQKRITDIIHSTAHPIYILRKAGSDHVIDRYFFCTACHTATNFGPELDISNLLPNGYILESAVTVINGRCKKCT